MKDRERDAEVERMSRYILNEVETSRHLISIRFYFILTILITEDDHNHIFFNNCNSAVFFSHKLLYYIKYMFYRCASKAFFLAN